MVEWKADSMVGSMDDLMVEYLVCWMAVLSVGGKAVMTVDSSVVSRVPQMERWMADH